MRDDGVEVLVEPPLRGLRAGDPLARQDVVRGDHERSPTRQQQPVDRGQRQPLEVDDVGGRCKPAIAEHGGDVLG
jgi:hypothetical protein